MNMKCSFKEKCKIRVPSRTWKARDLNFICPGPEIAWNLPPKVRKPGQNKKWSRKHG